MMNIITWIIVVITCLLLGLAGYRFYIAVRTRAWRQIAKEYGLEIIPSSGLELDAGNVTGTYGNREINLYTISPYELEFVLDKTCVEITVINTMDSYLYLYCKPTIYTVAASIIKPKEDTQIGEATIDQEYYIKCRPDGFAKAILDSSGIRHSLLNVRRGTSIELKGNKLMLQQNGIVGDGDYLRFLFDLLCKLGERIEDVSIKNYQ